MLSIAIVGLPNVGKSTLFNALTKKQIEASNYPFCTIDPNVGIVKVPDSRLEKLAEVSKSKEIIPTVIEFTDVAGLVRGAHKGEGLGNQFLSHIRECDAICEVVRDFENDDIIHVEGKVDPMSDRETINLELIMADLASVEKKLERVRREAKSGGKEILKLKDLLEKIKTHLEEGRSAREFEFGKDEKKMIKDLSLLTLKPIIYCLNVDDLEKEIDKDRWDGEVLKLNIKMEEEIASLSPDEQAEYIHELGLDRSGLDKLIRASYDLLGLITFFTSGEIETRAWTVKKGSTAPQAAGVIHTDFEKGFIRAETVGYEKFIELGGEKGAREKGALRSEGKDYIVRDGDVFHFLFSK